MRLAITTLFGVSTIAIHTARMRPRARPSWGRSSRGGGGLRRGERAGVVLAHQAAVARDIGQKDRRQPAFNLLPAYLVIGPQKTLLLKSPGSREVSICGGRPERHRYGLSCRGTASSNPAPSCEESAKYRFRWRSQSTMLRRHGRNRHPVAQADQEKWRRAQPSDAKSGGSARERQATSPNQRPTGIRWRGGWP